MQKAGTSAAHNSFPPEVTCVTLDYEPQPSSSTHRATAHGWTGPTALTVPAQGEGTAETAARRDVLIMDLRFTEGLPVAEEGAGAVAGTVCSSSHLQTTEGDPPSLYPSC